MNTLWVKKPSHYVPTFVCNFAKMLTDFLNFVTCRLNGKFAIKSSWNITPHLKWYVYVQKTGYENFLHQFCAELLNYSSILVFMSMGPTSVTCCCYNSCYLLHHTSGIGRVLHLSAPTHRVRWTISLLKREVFAFISPSDLWPQNSPDLNPVDYEIWSVMQQHVYQTKVQDVDDWSGNWLTRGLTCSRASLTMLLTNGGSVSMPVYEPEEDILSMHCDSRTILMNAANYWYRFIVKIYSLTRYRFQTIASFLALIFRTVV